MTVFVSPLGENECQSSRVLCGTLSVVINSPARSLDPLSPAQRRSAACEGCPACTLPVVDRDRHQQRLGKWSNQKKAQNTIWRWMPEHHQWSFPRLPYQDWQFCMDAVRLHSTAVPPGLPPPAHTWTSTLKLILVNSAQGSTTHLKNQSLDTR